MKQFDEQSNDVSTETSTLDAILIEGSENAILHEEVIVQEPAKDDLEEVVATPEEDSTTEDAISPIKDDKKKKIKKPKKAIKKIKTKRKTKTARKKIKRRKTAKKIRKKTNLLKSLKIKTPKPPSLGMRGFFCTSFARFPHYKHNVL